MVDGASSGGNKDRRKGEAMRRWFNYRLFIWAALPVLFFMALRQAPLQEIWQIIRSFTLAQALTLVALNLSILALFNARWWLILRAQKINVPFNNLLRYRLAGFAVSYFTPGAQFGGEPLQIYLLQNRHHLSSPTALAAVSLDKLFELLANFTFLCVGIVLILNGGLFQGTAHPQALVVVFGLLALPLLYLLALWRQRFPLSRLAARLAGDSRRRPWLDHFLPVIVATERQIAGLFIQAPRKIMLVLLLSGAIWIILLFEYWLTLRFLGATFNLQQTIAALTAARIAFLTPLPGGIGALEAGQAFAMQALGFSPALGISASLLIRARDLSLGFIGLWWAGVFTHARLIKPLISEARD